MMVMIVLFATGVALELAVHISGTRPLLRTWLAALALVCNAFACGVLAASQLSAFAVLIGLLTLYRIFNMIRVIERRMHEAYLRNATRTTTFTLLGLQVIIMASWLGWEQLYPAGHVVWVWAAVIQLAVAVTLLFSALRSLRSTTWPFKQSNYSDKELPTVTVAVAARNEIEGLRQCLESIIASDYPKLEILALDDRSQTRRTPEIIRGFAHDGVRFVQGREPAASWLAKNQAYDQLADESSGEYILFCGADIRFAPHSMRALIAAMLDRNKQMLCVLPRRSRESYGSFSLIQAMRYWWELIPPRRAFHRPPVQSACWVIRADALKKAGGFAAVARAIVPEAHFARQLVQADGYSFLRSSEALGVESTKSVAAQRQTALRMRYPQLHRRPEQVALVSLLELFFLVAPFVLAVVGFWAPIGMFAHGILVATCVLLTLAYQAAVLSMRVNTWWFGLIGQPLAALSDIVLLHYSMWKYEFSVVEWRGRDVAGSVMHVIPRLPAL